MAASLRRRRLEGVGLALLLSCVCAMPALACGGGGDLGKTWDIGAALTVSISQPQTGLLVRAGDEVACSGSGSDTDHWVQGANQGNEADSISYTWSANGGAWKNGVNTGASVTWIAPQTPGQYAITLTADDAGQVYPPDTGTREDGTASTSVTVTVCEGTPPVINIVKPAVDGEYVSGSVFVKAYISDASGVAWAKFYVNDVLKGDMWQESGYWRYNWDSSDTAKGDHIIKVEAADNSPLPNTAQATRPVFAHPAVTLIQISFKADHTLWNRAADLEIARPQWSAGAPPITKPFAYSIGAQMEVEPKMESQDVTGSVYIRYEVEATWKNSDGEDQGAYWKEKTTGPTTFPCSLAHYPNARDRVMDYRLDQSYDFYVRKSASSDWCPAGEANVTHPQVFLTFGAPVGPWGETPETPPKVRTCWSRVLKNACEWMPEDGYGSGQQAAARNRLAYKAFWSSGKDYDGGQYHYRTVNNERVLYLWQFILEDEADCQDMSLWWQYLCGSVGLDVGARRIQGGFNTKVIDPVGTPGWAATGWNFHHVGWYGNVFDPCVQLSESQTSPYTDARVPQNENIDSPYKRDLYQSGTWTPYAAFHIGDTDPFWNMPSKIASQEPQP